MHEDAANDSSLFAALRYTTIAAMMWNIHGAIISPAVGGDDAGGEGCAGQLSAVFGERRAVLGTSDCGRKAFRLLTW